MATKEKQSELRVCGRKMNPRNGGLIWKRGKSGEATVGPIATSASLIEVEIMLSAVRGINDCHVTVQVAGVLVFEEWMKTEELAAKWATKKLRLIFNAIGGAR